MISKAFWLLNLCLIFLLFSSNTLLQTNATSGNETDLLSLIAIRDGIQGLTSWNQSFHFCQWQGITCSKHHQRVTALNLHNQSLAGNLSPHIGNLSFLKFINLRDNNFYGEIPEEIGRLFRLQHLNISDNAFEGGIPVNLTQCSDLRYIDFRQNKLSGNIPPQLGSLSKLGWMALETNALTGEIPSSLGNLSSLQIFSVVDNSLEGSIPDAFGKLPRLTSFLVSSNKLSGEVPLAIFNISSIDTISISANRLTGTLPPDMGFTLPNLQMFTAAENQFSGPLPFSLPNASNLYNFDVANNNFTGKVPAGLGLLQYFTWINLAYNNLGSGEYDDLSFITHLTNSTDLRILCLSENNFGGVFPNAITNLSAQMQMLCLGGNQLYGIIPEGIGNLGNSIALGLENNLFSGSIPSSLGNIQSLQGLYLNGNNLTGLIPSSLGNITQLSELSLSGNKLEGSVPSSFGSFRFLQSLDISKNNLNNTIPKEIFSISTLSTLLDLSKNSFSGSLPLEVGNLQSLGHMDFSENKLSGEIPSTFARCISLEELHLENNFFEGAIPQSLTSLKNMRNLDLSNNSLSGEIPDYLGNFSALQRLNLSFNEFEGEVPMKGIFTNATGVSVAGNVKLCGGIVKLRLPTCQIKYAKKPERGKILKLAIPISVVLFFLLVASFIILYWRRKPKLQASSSTTSVRDQGIKVSYRDLFKATAGFSPTNFLGSGSFGRVYKGTLNRHEMTVAVKVFDLHQKGSSKSFMAECDSLRVTRHRNLVKVLTSCSSTDFQGNDFKALVFEFMPNGSLESWLHRSMEGKENQPKNLDLLQRMNIAIDIASALAYLHHQCHVSVIHRDLKPSNVLLDDDMVAHVGDFGLAKLVSGPLKQSATIAVKGSIGYTAPEYGLGGDASIQGDAYSFGVLLLELFTGKRPTDIMFTDGLNLHNLARRALPDRVMEIVDPELVLEETKEKDMEKNIRSWSFQKETTRECITSIVRIGVVCSDENPRVRMNMNEVAKELNFTRDVFLDQSGEETTSRQAQGAEMSSCGSELHR